MSERVIRKGSGCYRISAIRTARGGWCMRVESESRTTLRDYAPVTIDIEFDSEENVFEHGERIVTEIENRRARPG
ncbi:hypothetical protein WCQ02_35965 [Paraburkholderia tropica]|uniref:DUF2866 domain-containing protein n=1 Tax=Paraburkholderia tropica TaxID=92647 RepID=A0ABX5MFJ6_9BURK|nr:hypothetical protein [Paraburkholderia tropica]PXX07057.1 hypothetical protein C7400_13236 [Paraburkholderia tropica]PZW72494.1 hypothetical protein C7399_13236 [Paraburkholderia tropica]